MESEDEENQEIEKQECYSAPDRDYDQNGLQDEKQEGIHKYIAIWNISKLYIIAHHLFIHTFE